MTARKSRPPLAAMSRELYAMLAVCCAACIQCAQVPRAPQAPVATHRGSDTEDTPKAPAQKWNVPVRQEWTPCAVDVDCVEVPWITCDQCCVGSAINKTFLETYHDAYSEQCATFSGAMCDCYGTPAVIGCFQGRCSAQPVKKEHQIAESRFDFGAKSPFASEGLGAEPVRVYRTGGICSVNIGEPISAFSPHGLMTRWSSFHQLGRCERPLSANGVAFRPEDREIEGVATAGLSIRVTTGISVFSYFELGGAYTWIED